MELTERQKRISLLARQNIGRQQQSEYLSRLSEALFLELTPESLVPLPETDSADGRLLEEFKASKETGSHQLVRRSEAKDLWERLSRLGGSITESIFVFPRGFDCCGAIRIPARNAILHCAELLEFDGDRVAILATNQAAGLYLDLYHEEEDSLIETLELDIWGPEWVKLSGQPAKS